MGSITETPRGERMAAILLYLIHRRNRKHSVDEILSYLNQSENVILRNVQRDCKRLAECHDDVIGIERRDGRLYYFVKPDIREKLSLPLSRNSLLALFLLKRLQPFFAPQSKNMAQMTEALAEIGSMKESELFEDLDARLADSTVSFGEKAAGSISDDLFESMLEALVNRKKLLITYRKSVDREPASATICPVRLVLYRGSLYFASVFNSTDDHFYYYKLCRIITATLTGEAFKVSKEQMARVNKRLTTSFGMFDGDDAELEDVVIKFPPWFDLLLQEHLFHHTQKAKRDKDKNMVLSMQVPVNADLVQWVLGWGEQAEVVKPQKLKTKLRKAGEYLVKAYK